LIEDVEPRSYQNEFINDIAIDKIEVNPFQPRTHFDEEALIELAASIKELGVIQPITIRETENGSYQLISGERRSRAAKLAGLTHIPAYIRKANDQTMLEMALVENIQREELDPIEIALSYKRLIEECKLTQENLSERVGKKRSTVTNYMRLLKLPVEIQKGIRNRKISMGHARALVSVEDTDIQIKLCLDIIEQEFSVRQTEEAVRKIVNPGKVRTKSSKANLPESYIALEKHLTDFFSTRVEFKRDNKGKGKIVIPFQSDDDLERIIAVLDKLNS